MVRALLCALFLVLVMAVSAPARTVDVPARLSPVLGNAQESGLVVLVPTQANLDYKSGGRIYADGSGERGEYSLTLSAAKRCQSNACFLAEFTGVKGAKLGYKATNVKLALGLKGYYSAGSCGASCSAPFIAWIEKGVRYEIQAKALGGRAAFIKMANSAINAGNRK